MIWDKKDHNAQSLQGHTGRVQSVDFHPLHFLLCTAGEDTKTILWDTIKVEQISALPSHPSSIRQAQFLGSSDYENCLVTACADNLCRLWDIRQQKQIGALPVPGHRCSSVAPHVSHHLLATGSDIGQAVAWDLRTFNVLESFDFDTTDESLGLRFKNGVSSISISPCCEYMAVGSEGGSVVVVQFKQRVWEKLEGHSAKVSSLAWGADWPYETGESSRPYLLSASHDHCWKCWIPTLAKESEGATQKPSTSKTNLV